MKRYPKRALPRHRAQGKRSAWRKRRIELREQWRPTAPEHPHFGIEVLTGATLDHLAFQVSGMSRNPGETDNEFRDRLNTRFQY